MIAYAMLGLYVIKSRKVIENEKNRLFKAVEGEEKIDMSLCQLHKQRS
jgi:hypothetical protein